METCCQVSDYEAEWVNWSICNLPDGSKQVPHPHYPSTTGLQGTPQREKNLSCLVFASSPVDPGAAFMTSQSAVRNYGKCAGRKIGSAPLSLHEKCDIISF